MNRKSISLFCAFLVGSIFSLSITLFCDLGMDHQLPQVVKSSSTSCHGEVNHSKESNPESCPILFGLLDAKEGIVKESPRIDSGSLLSVLPLAMDSNLVTLERTASRIPEIRPPGRLQLPIYLQNPVLRI